jgi:hypothetical protein
MNFRRSATRGYSKKGAGETPASHAEPKGPWNMDKSWIHLVKPQDLNVPCRKE